VVKNKRKIDAVSRGDHSRDAEADAMLIVDSQRNGEGWTGSIQLWFDQKSFQFLESPHAEPRSWIELDAMAKGRS